MLSYEWRELETLCGRIADLRERYANARRSKNMGLIDSLKDEINLAQRQRELLVHHISARLGSVAAGTQLDDSPIHRARRRRAAARQEAAASSAAAPTDDIIDFEPS
jgi:hypothetical protein